MYPTPPETLAALTSNMDPQLDSRICTLPPELRNKIYDSITASYHDTKIEAAVAVPPMNTMLFTCKKIFGEACALARAASPSYWADNTFLFERMPGASPEVVISEQDGHIIRQIKRIGIMTDTRRLTVDTNANFGLSPVAIPWHVAVDGGSNVADPWLQRMHSGRCWSCKPPRRGDVEKLAKSWMPLREPTEREVDDLGHELIRQRVVHDLQLILNLCRKKIDESRSSLYSYLSSYLGRIVKSERYWSLSVGRVECSEVAQPVVFLQHLRFE